MHQDVLLVCQFLKLGVKAVNNLNGLLQLHVPVRLVRYQVMIAFHQPLGLFQHILIWIRFNIRPQVFYCLKLRQGIFQVDLIS